jgi:hypothetical protein
VRRRAKSAESAELRIACAAWDPSRMRGGAVIVMATLPALASCGARAVPQARGETAIARPPGPPDDSARRTCEAECRRDARCGEAKGCGPCDAVAGEAVIRPDWARAAASCADGLACDRSLDACAREARSAIGIDALALPPVVLRCLQKGDQCGGRSADCLALAALTDAWRDQADACFAERSCAAYAARFAAFRARVRELEGAGALLGLSAKSD